MHLQEYLHKKNNQYTQLLEKELFVHYERLKRYQLPMHLNLILRASKLLLITGMITHPQTPLLTF